MQQTFETWITPIMIGGLIIFMCFIIWDLAKIERRQIWHDYVVCGTRCRNVGLRH